MVEKRSAHQVGLKLQQNNLQRISPAALRGVLAGNVELHNLPIYTLCLPPLVAPVIRAVESSITVVLGDSVTMSCVASGDPTPTQTWSRNGVGVAGPRVQLSADGSALTLTTTTLQDEGAYTCHASNPASTQTDTVTLNIIGESHDNYMMIT